MKYPIKLLSTLFVLGLPGAVQAACDFYMNSEHGLSMPATVIVPDSLPVGAEIIRRPFSGVVPPRFMDCPTGTRVRVFGRYSGMPDPVTGYWRTEVPGVAISINITDATPRTNSFGFTSGETTLLRGRHPIYTNAEAVFIKSGPVTDGVVPAGLLWRYSMLGFGPPPGSFRLDINSPIRFVRPSATCDLAAGDVNRTITLPAIQTSALRDAVYAGTHNFDLTANCTNAANVTFRFTGTPASGNTALFANTGTAGGVGLWLSTRDRTATITPTAPNNTRAVTVSSNRAVLPLSVAYHRNGTVSQGTLVSTATVNITYN